MRHFYSARTFCQQRTDDIGCNLREEKKLPSHKSVGDYVSNKKTNEIGIELVMLGAFILLFLPFCANLVSALFVPQPVGNIIFGMVATTFVGALLWIACRYFLLFAIHAKQIDSENGELVIHRFFAPKVHLELGSQLKNVSVVVPSLSAPPYYRRGHLFLVGLSSFIVGDAELHDMSVKMEKVDLGQ